MRAKLYLIAAALFHQPDPDTLRRVHDLASLLQSEALQEPWDLPLAGLADLPTRCDDELIAEYTRLFVLGRPQVAAQPFASYWLEGETRLMGQATLLVRQMMAAHGLRAEGGFLPDHIVSELEFMAWLAERGESTRETQCRLIEHLACWTPQFTAALRDARPSARFAIAAEFLDRLVARDRVHLESGSRHRTGHSLSQGVA